MDKRARVYYSGAVQGVGFRFTAERVAASLGVKGWAGNLEDGRVEVICEGPEASLHEFLRKVAVAFKAYIRDVDVEWSEPTGEFEGFDIRIQGR